MDTMNQLVCAWNGHLLEGDFVEATPTERVCLEHIKAFQAAIERMKK